MVIIMILSTINITAICTFCFKGINALNAYRAKMWTFLLRQNRFADNFCFFSHVWGPQAYSQVENNNFHILGPYCV